MSYQLRIKAISLALEAQAIRKDERKALVRRDRAKTEKRRTKLYNQYADLRMHRVIDVRNEARATNIARGFLRGLRYDQIETLPKGTNRYDSYLLSNDGPNWDRVLRLIEKYGDKEDRARLDSWLAAIGMEKTVSIRDENYKRKTFSLKPKGNET